LRRPVPFEKAMACVFLLALDSADNPMPYFAAKETI
jgi:hypothetical protein